MNTKHASLSSTIRRTALALALAGAASGAQAAHFIYTGGHGLEDETLAALGHTYTNACFESYDERAAAKGDAPKGPSNEDCWLAVLNGDYGPFNAIVFGEGGYVPSEAVQIAIRSYLNNGGKIIVIDDHYGNTDFLNNDLLLSTSAAYECMSDDSVAATKTAAAAGTTFADDPNEVRNASCTSGLATASLPAGAKTFYAGETYPYNGKRTATRNGTPQPQDEVIPTSLAWGHAYGSGTLIGLGWDFCCAATQETSDAWYMVMDSALRYTAFTGSANLRLGFSGPTTTIRANSPAIVYARLDNYGRDTALNPVVNISVGWPVQYASVSATGWTCTGGELTRTPAVDVPVGLNYECRANAGTMPRGSIVFKVALTTPGSTPGGFVSISGNTSSDSIDPVPGNNAGSFKLYVRSAPSFGPVQPPVN